MQRPKVSVIIPVYNRENLIRRAIDSVLRQSYRDYEIVVVDDGSTDSTPRELDSYGGQIKVIRQANRGPYAARNAGIKSSEGEYIAFLDSDDEWFPERLAKQVPLLDAGPELGLVYGNGELIDDANAARRRVFFEHGNKPKRGRVFAELIECNFVPQSSVLLRRECLNEVGLFWELPLSADYHKWLQIALRYPVDYVEDIVFRYHLHGGNIIHDRISQYRNNIRIFEYFLRAVTDPDLLTALRRRDLELNYELALVCCRDGVCYLFRALFGARNGISLPRRVAVLLRLAAVHATCLFRKAIANR